MFNTIKVVTLSIITLALMVMASPATAQDEPTPEPISPGISELYCPVDTTTPSTFNFVFSKPSNSTWIRIQINQGTDRIYREEFPATSICKHNYCKVNVGTALPIAAYTWYVQGWNNSANYGEWSEGANFGVQTYGSHETECCPRNSATETSGIISNIDSVTPIAPID